MKTATALLGSLLWLEMVRPGVARAGGRRGLEAGRLLALSLSHRCRSEDRPLPAVREHAKGHVRDLRLVPSGDEVQARVSGCGSGP